MKLNLGCGLCKLEGYLNIDIDKNLEPDQVFDITNVWPFSEDSVEEIVMYHTIEHISKSLHGNIYAESYRTLKPGGTLTLTFPEFSKCVENWKTNYRGLRRFWEATIYGRQASASDYHVCIMDTQELTSELIRHGFCVTFKGSEPFEPFNSIVRATKDKRYTYEEALAGTIHVNAG